jgi:hypothetical protein
MRSLIFNSHVEYLNVIKIICINIILLLLSSSFFLYTLNVVRKKGIMINQGE